VPTSGRDDDPTSRPEGGLVTVECGWVEFDALVEPMPWGRNVYIVIRLNQALENAARTSGTRRVEGTIDDVPVNVGVNRADVFADAFMYAGKGLLRLMGARPGDVVHCRLRPADPDDVPLAEDIDRALAQAGRLEAFERKTPAQRRRLLQPIVEAVKPETRQQRIAALLSSLLPD
jgi:hypothetical protein